MKVLALSSRKNLTPKRVRNYRDELGLGHDLELNLVMVSQPEKRLPVNRLDVVEPTRLKFAPMVPVQGPGLRTWGGPNRLLARCLRASRAVSAKLAGRQGMEDASAHRTYLTRAARHNRELARLARQADVILALDAGSTAAVAELGTKAPDATLVHGTRHVRQVLRSLEIPVPTGLEVAVSAPDPDTTAHRARSLDPLDPSTSGQRLLIAPANYAGQAHSWALSVRRHVPGAMAENLRAGELKNQFPSDMLIDRESFNSDLEWRLAWREKVMRDYTHVIVEANLPILGRIVGRGIEHATELQRHGKQVALLSHGSDARIPSVHAARERWHSYGALTPAQLDAFERTSRHNCEDYNTFGGTVFVSTPGLLEFIPKATWLPLAINPQDWAAEHPQLGSKRPVVAHIPSSTQKGSHMIDPILQDLHERGLIEYLRVEGVQHREMPALYKRADFMVEQFGIADYSVAACEAMASGCVVVSRVADSVRETVREVTGLELPIVEANPETLESVLMELAADPERCGQIAEDSIAFVSANHDGRRSAEVLSAWMNESTA